MKDIFVIVLLSLGLVACKSSKETTSAKPSAKPALSNTQKADVTYLFFNANKEKILGNLISGNEGSNYPKNLRLHRH